jgi:hypothetical protein
MNKRPEIPAIVKFHKGKGEPILFFPCERVSNLVYLCCYEADEGHNEASTAYFWECKPPRGAHQEAKAAALVHLYENLSPYPDENPRLKLVKRDRQAFFKIRTSQPQ